MPSGDDAASVMLDRWSRGEYEPRPSEIHPDVKVVSQVAGKTFHGYGGVRRWASELNRSFDNWSFVVDELLETPIGGRLAVGHLHLCGGKRTRSNVEAPAALLFSLDSDGLIVRIDAFPNRVDEAYAAAGLERQLPA
jgi:hypothetical protein